ncbi:transcription elongation factor NusA [Sulfodiicoccus acidiphilus]|uniref:Probable transcription termination protein NusA n=1 Tax=Sulfodiicoccus acidiphilus TaxID=1670455 RepID=A0A348B0E7_9CREN|nr:NusA-like transcription termination signal-binding factor [Sulfodiicoccus acidiphilus]BBD71649.1 transcription elongation factor NusA [Sulfodiicoccus acidiphilus]GGT86865.1 transcription elongation factor NusA [Sulfodiicoccus acidiphilus]
MPEIKLTPEGMRFLSLFQDFTKVTARDCIIDEEGNRIVFLVDPSDMGLAIGKNGANVKRLRKVLNREVEVVAYSNSLEDMVKNLMMPARVRSIRLVQTDSKKTLYITVAGEDKGLAIGKNGKNVSRAKLILKRYMDVDSVVIV